MGKIPLEPVREHGSRVVLADARISGPALTQPVWSRLTMSPICSVFLLKEGIFLIRKTTVLGKLLF